MVTVDVINHKIKRISMVVATILITYHLSLITSNAQEISYAGSPRECEIGGIAVKGVSDYEDYVLINLSGLSVGQKIDVPGSEITEAVKRYWKHGLFSDVSIKADSIIDSKVYLTIDLQLRPASLR